MVFSNIANNIFKSEYSQTLRTIGSRKYVFDYKSLTSDLFIYERSKYKVILFAGSEDARVGICDYLTKYGIFASDNINMASNKFQVIVSDKKFSKSCSFLDAGIIIIGTDDLIKKSKAEVKNVTNKAKKQKQLVA